MSLGVAELICPLRPTLLGSSRAVIGMHKQCTIPVVDALSPSPLNVGGANYPIPSYMPNSYSKVLK